MESVILERNVVEWRISPNGAWDSSLPIELWRLFDRAQNDYPSISSWQSTRSVNDCIELEINYVSVCGSTILKCKQHDELPITLWDDCFIWQFQRKNNCNPKLNVYYESKQYLWIREFLIIILYHILLQRSEINRLTIKFFCSADATHKCNFEGQKERHSVE